MCIINFDKLAKHFRLKIMAAMYKNYGSKENVAKCLLSYLSVIRVTKKGIIVANVFRLFHMMPVCNIFYVCFTLQFEMQKL